MIRYRKPGQDDPMIQQLIESQLVPLSHMTKKELDTIRKDIPSRLRRGVTLVASNSDHEKVIAFIHFMMHGELLYIDMLAVAPTAQRKRWGIRLMEHAERFAVSRGCKRAKVMVDIGNQTGLNFYRKLGYTVTRIIEPSQCYELEKIWYA
ncbi:GCN5-related N-acetyltransferase [Paenibacillus vortex V453]|jgi:ribosomal protein S18 acetylase RimI-like enzyme|uniref:GCN5 family acetyltransferase n=2 Tax=Paenibacillus TaxID=44249 RepID=A0A163FPR5_9BACL|nr:MULTISPECIES: GNAT family N-acetyltransferase [Paenibacillus]ANA79100.1 GCN5 family acetyltransferase [Paenibacillus glucanolyticus]AVV56968.1 N-acetyltransferase [Paenibacillus glucanolyticus]AWP26126.1 N-acetyltransferase [Paenibacillus sp. Cedars]EFU39069.1 GCN5-related N-acetyltransferase [Paenibacillus vortex V453]ETT39248.1 GCN5-like N-acetyltransferase [Paenibacillus sp. FSL R5-808]